MGPYTLRMPQIKVNIFSDWRFAPGLQTAGGHPPGCLLGSLKAMRSLLGVAGSWITGNPEVNFPIADHSDEVQISRARTKIPCHEKR